MPAEFGISLHCVKPLDSLEFRPFNFKVQAHLLVWGSLTESPGVFTSKKSVPYPVFWDVYKHSWDARCISPIQTEHLKFRSYLGWRTGIWKLEDMSLQTCGCTLTPWWPKYCRLIALYQVSGEDFATFLTSTIPQLDCYQPPNWSTWSYFQCICSHSKNHHYCYVLL